MNAVLDASALVSLLAGEAGATAVAAVMAPGVAVSALNYAEARDLLLRRANDRAQAGRRIDDALGRGLRVIACDLAGSTEAADLRAAHYHSTRLAVSLAGCVAVVTARSDGARLVTSDQDQATLAGLVGVDVLPVANSRGVVPKR